MKKIKYFIGILLSYFVNINFVLAQKNLNFQGNNVQLMYGVEPQPPNLLTSNISIWKKLLVILFSPIGIVLLFLLALIIGTVIFIKKRRKHKKIIATYNVKKNL